MKDKEEEAKSREVKLWTAKRAARIAVFGALTGALSLIPIPVMPGMTLDPAIAAFAAVYYGAFEGYWSYVVGQAIRMLLRNPGEFLVCPLAIFMGSPCCMTVIAWIVRKVRYPWNIPAGILSGIGFHAFTIFPYCVVYYGWDFTPFCFMMQVIGGTIVVSICTIIALGGSMYMWKIHKQPIFPWRFIPVKECFSIANRKRIIISFICMIILAAIAYGFCFSPYASYQVLGAPESIHRKYADAWIRHPITLGIGWFFWEIYKRHGEWLKQTE